MLTHTMKPYLTKTLRHLLAILVLSSSLSSVYAGCGGNLALQVLGSGGPTVDQRRASSSYILWINGQARVLLDTGSGSFTRFGAAGGRIEDLDLIALSHLHVDHAVELPAYIKAGYFISRERPLPIAGPSANEPFPSIKAFMSRLFDPKQGAFAYLSGTLTGTEGQFKTPVIEIAHKPPLETLVLETPTLRVLAKPVPHGPVPTLAYRIETQDKIIVYGADQNADDLNFAKFAHQADLLIMPLAIPEDITGSALELHAKPSEVGNLAKLSQAKQLLLSHIMPRSEQQLQQLTHIVQRAYGKPAQVAEDLLCIELN